MSKNTVSVTFQCNILNEEYSIESHVCKLYAQIFLSSLTHLLIHHCSPHPARNHCYTWSLSMYVQANTFLCFSIFYKWNILIIIFFSLLLILQCLIKIFTTGKKYNEFVNPPPPRLDIVNILLVFAFMHYMCNREAKCKYLSIYAYIWANCTYKYVLFYLSCLKANDKYGTCSLNTFLFWDQLLSANAGFKESSGMLGCNHLACGREAIQVTVTVVQGRGIDRSRASWGAGGLGGGLGVGSTLWLIGQNKERWLFTFFRENLEKKCVWVHVL